MTTKLQDALPLRVKPRALLHVQIEMQHLDSTSGCELSAKVSTQPYILKADVLDVRTPQKIQVFRRKIVWERENYQSQSLKANNSAMCYK